MARLDVYRTSSLPDGFIVDVQSDFLWTLKTRAVVPLLRDGVLDPVPHLNPIFEIAGKRYVMATQGISTVPARNLRGLITSLLDNHDVVLRALDTLFLGF